MFRFCGFCMLLKALTTEAATGPCKTLILTRETGTLAYSVYPKNVTCITWIITVPAEHLVKLRIITFFYQSPSCKNSILQIHDGQNSSGDAFESLCGLGKNLATLFSSGRHLWVRLQASTNDTADLYAVFEAVNQSAVGSCRGPKDTVISLTSRTGRFFSPLFPNHFPEGTKCTWVIIAPEGHFVKLRIKSFSLDRSCLYSNLQIRDGQSSTSDSLNKLCGEKAAELSVFSSGRYLRIELHSLRIPVETPYYAAGFDAVYEAVKQLPALYSCTARTRSITLESQTGLLASYNYPLHYDDEIECTWRFDVDSNYKIQLSFDVFNLSLSPECSDDYVQVDNKRYCGSQKPAPITLDSSDMRVTFKSSGKTKYPGFKASYEAKRTAAAILTIVGICVGAALTTLCVVTKLCFWCCRSDDQAQLTFAQVTNAETEDTRIQEQDSTL
ncbi:hypothetical protein OS493_033506 [Desmophyllum pertusum]|uniref:CUB domain-containing protein n=1 Tax=Desmophyllum pertusum TaxID=174260 RepID=A0A9W9Z9N1_9CNID|nr:hypothetical protein OS493_033506 [Desmophyllum pertusum]